MKRHLLIAGSLVLLLFSSCSTYLVSTIDSTNLKKDKETGILVSDTDSIRFSYSFNQANSPVKILIENTSATPILIDWSKSAMIINEVARNYYSGKVNFSADAKGVSREYDWTQPVTLSRTNVVGEAKLPEEFSFIPPRSRVEKTVPISSKDLTQTSPETDFKKISIMMSNGMTNNLKVAEFNDTTSPVKFRSYISYHPNGDKTNKVKSVEHPFFVETTYKSSTYPEDNEFYKLNRADILFYNRRDEGPQPYKSWPRMEANR